MPAQNRTSSRRASPTDPLDARPGDENGAGWRKVKVPEHPQLEGLEERWVPRWEQWQTYRFDPTKPREDVYSIDTPPPTVSGALHIGHVFSYTQTDVIARFQRMRGKTVFYPVGWDDNGLATERRVQNHFGVRCDPSIPYDPDFTPPSEPPREQLPISRPNFVELCQRLTLEDEGTFEGLFSRLGLSVDWRTKYTTIGQLAQRTSQEAFLRMVERGDAYRKEAPTLWDVDFRTAVAQAELEDREVESTFVGVAFTDAESGAPIPIATTRPELIPACVALVANPDDDRYRALIGRTALTPLFGVEVPIHAHHLADPDKGTGIAMVCTFGDLTDVTWWRELGLPTRAIVGREGRIEQAPFGSPGWESRDPLAARRLYSELEGLPVRRARSRIVELLGESGELLGEPEPITHFVNFYEKGEKPLEIVSSRQWYVRTMDRRPELLAAGERLRWHPRFMHARYEAWIEGLSGDWNISRQRYFGVPFPVWYRLLDDGTTDDDHPILAGSSQLPVDPSTSAPEGFSEGQRGAPGGFAADPDVMDTWATSSLSPQIAGHWIDAPDLFERIFPMDLRPQAHDIIRTWLFSTVVRSSLEHDSVPWRNVAISGWILDPDRKKLSKSKGNATVPSEYLDSHGTDAVRYWSASARLGVDTVLDDQQMRIGRRLAIKILNASRFILSRLATGDDDREVAVSHPLDLALLASLRAVVTDATEALERYEHARALERTEQFFWGFCDDYLELVKTRAYSEGQDASSARAALGAALGVVLRLFAPFLPYCTEEAWSWGHDQSIHTARWPLADQVASERGDPGLLGDAAVVLGAIRRAKSEAKRSMRSSVARVEVSAPPGRLGRLLTAGDDLKSAGVVNELAFVEGGEELAVSVSLQAGAA